MLTFALIAIFVAALIYLFVPRDRIHAAVGGARKPHFIVGFVLVTLIIFSSQMVIWMLVDSAIQAAVLAAVWWAYRQLASDDIQQAQEA